MADLDTVGVVATITHVTQQQLSFIVVSATQLAQLHAHTHTFKHTFTSTPTFTHTFIGYIWYIPQSSLLLRNTYQQLRSQE